MAALLYCVISAPYHMEEGRGGGGGLMVRMLTFCSDELSLSPAEVYSFSSNILFEKNENKQKEASIDPVKNASIVFSALFC